MGYDNVSELIEQIKAANANITAADARTDGRIDELARSIDELYRRTGRPGFSGDGGDANADRRSAVEMCKMRHDLLTPKIDAGAPDHWEPNSTEIDEALTARRCFHKVLRGGEQRVDATEKKSLSAFNFHGSGLLLPPEDMGRTLDCLVQPTQISGLVDQVTTSAPSVRFLIESPRMAVGGWACEASCWANNQQPEIAAGLGTLEIKPETIRYVACATADLISDDGFSIVINEALIVGDGVGKPAGLLHPSSGIPICNVAAATPAGTFDWRDLVQLKFQIPEAWWPDSVFVMNQQTAGMLFSMSDALTRPLFGAFPEGQPGFQFAGSRIVIVSQMPNVEPGSIPILFGNLRRTYTMVIRKAVTLIVDPYSAGFCTLFRFESRVGGACTCPNASRLLRIR